MSRRNSLVVPGGKMGFAMEIILQPIIRRMMEGRTLTEQNQGTGLKSAVGPTPNGAFYCPLSATRRRVPAIVAVVPFFR